MDLCHQINGFMQISSNMTSFSLFFKFNMDCPWKNLEWIQRPPPVVCIFDFHRKINNLLTSSDSERINSAHFSRSSDTRDVSRITVSTLPSTSKYPKLPEPPNQPSVLTGEIQSEDTPQNEPWTTRLRPRRPPTPSFENGYKRRAETSSKTLKPTRRYRKNL